MDIPYGGKPYIFISYSHKNSSYIRTVVSRMGKLGYRVWCDDDLPYVNDYNNIIANTIMNCEMFVVFFSHESVESEYVLDELYLARNRNKNIMAVFIDDCQLPPGAEMRLGRYNHLLPEDYSSRDELIEKICTECASCRDIQECTPQFSQKAEERAAKAPPIAPPQPKAESKSAAKPTTATVKSAVIKPVVSTEALSPAPTKKKSSPKLPAIIISVFAVAIAIAVGLWIVLGYSFTYEINGYTFKCREQNGEITIENCPYDYIGTLEIPAKINNTPVTTIGAEAFYSCGRLTGISIPNSVTSIGDSAFRGCSNLTEVTIPNSVTSIGDSAFGGCSSLTSITIPDNITTIGAYLFYNCKNLTTLTIPDSVIIIQDQAFSGCHNLTSIIIPDSVTDIGYNVFGQHSVSSQISTTIYCSRDSYAWDYCERNNIPHAEA